jgi:mono/diheme cytochrome c family protein
MSHRPVRPPSFLLGAACAAALLVPARAVDYVTDIFPIFEQKCFQCHSVREGQSKGSLQLDNLEDMEGFYIGPNTTMKPGNPDESLLLEFVSDPESPDTMPPRGKGDRLTPEEIGKVRQWLAEGAKVHPPKPGPAGMAKAVAPEVHDWTNAEGKTIRARFVRLGSDAVELLLENGRKYAYPLEKLSPQSQELARKLAR